MIRETKPVVTASGLHQPTGSFVDVWRDTRFIAFCALTILVVFASSQMMTVLPVYMKDQYGLGASYYGWVMTTNAAMVVLFQFAITRAIERYARLPAIAVGAIFYGIGVASVALGSTFSHFILSMVVITIGEMIVMPTSNSIAADSAPITMRGRYMGMLGLSWSVGFGIGPVLGGLVNDHISPYATWWILGSSALLGAIGYLILGRVASKPIMSNE
jgi:MFS family permease